MRRRAFLVDGLAAAVASLLSTPSWARRDGRAKRIAVAALAGPVQSLHENASSVSRAFFDELRRRHYAEGRNLVVDRRTAQGLDHGGRRAMVGELVALQPDAIVAFTFALAHEFRTATTTIPIAAYVLDPIEYGLVKSLARPEANVTGVAADGGLEVLGKQLDLLLTAAPRTKRVAVFSANRTHAMATLVAAAERASVALHEVPMKRALPHRTDYEAAFEVMRRDGVDGLLVVDGVQHGGAASIIAPLAAQYGLPTVSASRHFTEQGCLMSYEPDDEETARRLAAQVARPLDGAAPRDLPFEQPTRFRLVINLPAAKALGLALPPSLLARADEVIE